MLRDQCLKNNYPCYSYFPLVASIFLNNIQLPKRRLYYVQMGHFTDDAEYINKIAHIVYEGTFRSNYIKINSVHMIFTHENKSSPQLFLQS